MDNTVFNSNNSKDKFKSREFMFEDFVNIVKSNLFWIIGIFVFGWIVAPNSDITRTILLICLLECIAFGFSKILIYLFLNFGSTKYLVEGDDGKANSVERHSALGFAGYIVLGVHLLVAISFYLLQFNIKS